MFGPYVDFADCLSKNQDKASPEGFCAWLHQKIIGTWPAGMATDKYPEPWLVAYDAALVAERPETEAFKEAETAAEEAGFEKTRSGWVKQFQAPTLKQVSNVDIFAAGTWTDSAGYTRDWTSEDLDKMVVAFKAGVPVIVALKCGHTSDDFNLKIAEALGVPVEVITGDEGQGQIKIGNMTSLERRDDILRSAFDNVPEPISDLIESGLYSTVSVEIEDEIGEYGPVITGVALLGAEDPAVDKATLERALVFGGIRKGARVWSFKKGEDIPDPVTLRSEFDDIKNAVAEVIKGKKGAPLFRALFGNITELFEKMVGKSSQSKGGKTEYHTVHERMRFLAMDLGLPDDASIEDIMAELQRLQAEEDQVNDALAKNKSRKGGTYQMDLKVIAQLLGLGEEATEEEVMAALQALIDAAAATAAAAAAAKPEDEGLAASLKEATDKVEALQKQVDSQTSLSKWKEKTITLTSIPGTPTEIANKLANIETKAGEEVANEQFAALEEANKLAFAAAEVLGTARIGAPTDFDNEVTKYMSEHTDATKVQAIEAISKARPDLYFARRERQ